MSSSNNENMALNNKDLNDTIQAHIQAQGELIAKDNIEENNIGRASTNDTLTDLEQPVENNTLEQENQKFQTDALIETCMDINHCSREKETKDSNINAKDLQLHTLSSIKQDGKQNSPQSNLNPQTKKNSKRETDVATASSNKESVSCDTPDNTNVTENQCDNVANCDNEANISNAILPEKLASEIHKLNISGEEKKVKLPKSEVIVNKQTDSLRKLLVYNGSSSEDEDESKVLSESASCESDSDESQADENITKRKWRNHKDNVIISATSDSESDSTGSELSSESDSESEDSESVREASNDEDNARIEQSVLNQSDKGAVKKNAKKNNDMQEFLPPVPDLSTLNINVENEEFLHIGDVDAIIADLVTVEANPGTPAFDLDSYLFIEDETSKKPLGSIFDVLGPVTKPIYCVRFNTAKEVQDLNLKKGMKVYVAPKSEYTKFVFVKELMKMKGTDASWLNDQEQPADLVEYSDDEAEREARRNTKKNTLKRKLDDSVERHKRYERTMNQCNTLNTRVSRLMDTHRNLSRQIRPNHQQNRTVFESEMVNPPAIPFMHPIPAAFDPTVPPPGFGQLNHMPTAPASAVIPPPVHWGWQNQNDMYRTPPRSSINPANPRSGNQNNSANYYTNNGRNLRDAGSSSYQSQQF